MSVCVCVCVCTYTDMYNLSSPASAVVPRTHILRVPPPPVNEDTLNSYIVKGRKLCTSNSSTVVFTREIPSPSKGKSLCRTSKFVITPLGVGGDSHVISNTSADCVVTFGAGWNVGGASRVCTSEVSLEPHPPDVQARTRNV